MFDIEKMRIVPMTLGKYFESRGWSVPYDLPKTTKGYKIESETGLSSWMSMRNLGISIRNTWG